MNSDSVMIAKYVSAGGLYPQFGPSAVLFCNNTTYPSTLLVGVKEPDIVVYPFASISAFILPYI